MLLRLPVGDVLRHERNLTSALWVTDPGFAASKNKVQMSLAEHQPPHLCYLLGTWDT